MKSNLLIIDDDESLASFLVEMFKEDYDVASFSDPSLAIQYLRENNVDVVLTDMVMPKIGGMEILQIVKSEFFDVDVICMTAFSNVESAVEMMKKGAVDYIVKPFKPDELSLRLKNIFSKRKLIEDNVFLHKVVNTMYRPENMIGESASMREVYRLIEVFSQNDLPVLITGETGVGKELTAKALHFSGRRKGKRFVSINCSAIPENLLESELFGHMKGSFSGAGANKKGLFELAEGGTIFLDEIGDLPVSLQPKLLRTLQEREVRPLGGTHEIIVDARVICATNKDLTKMIQEKEFRVDLYYRINAATIHLSPLRERKEDIALYVSHFLGGKKRVHPKALRLLYQYSWPGNVRELKHIVERLMILTDGKVITPFDIPPLLLKFTPSFDCEQSYTDSKRKLVEEFDLKIITGALLKCYGNVTKAAKHVGLDRRNFQKLMRKCKITHDTFIENSKSDASN